MCGTDVEMSYGEILFRNSKIDVKHEYLIETHKNFNFTCVFVANPWRDMVGRVTSTFE